MIHETDYFIDKKLIKNEEEIQDKDIIGIEDEDFIEEENSPKTNESMTVMEKVIEEDLMNQINSNDLITENEFDELNNEYNNKKSIEKALEQYDELFQKEMIMKDFIKNWDKYEKDKMQITEFEPIFSKFCELLKDGYFTQNKKNMIVDRIHKSNNLSNHCKNRFVKCIETSFKQGKKKKLDVLRINTSKSI